MDRADLLPAFPSGENSHCKQAAIYHEGRGIAEDSAGMHTLCPQTPTPLISQPAIHGTLISTTTPTRYGRRCPATLDKGGKAQLCFRTTRGT